MNLTAEFINDAMRTNNEMAGQYGNRQSNLVIHAILGVVDETWELVTAADNVNRIEELGDLRWFFALFQHTTAIQLDFSKGELDMGATDEWTYRLVSIAKRMFAYGESVEKHQQEITYLMQNLGHSLLAMVSRYSKQNSLSDIASDAEAVVVNKLRARFPEKFTQDHAINRDIGYEREILEQTIQSNGTV